MITNFKLFVESGNVEEITNGPRLTAFSGDNRQALWAKQSIAGGNGGSIGDEFDLSGEPTSSGEITFKQKRKDYIYSKDFSKKRKELLKKLKQIYRDPI